MGSPTAPHPTLSPALPYPNFPTLHPKPYTHTSTTALTFVPGNLSAAQIVEQVIQAKRFLAAEGDLTPATNLVFMVRERAA